MHVYTEQDTNEIVTRSLDRAPTFNLNDSTAFTNNYVMKTQKRSDKSPNSERVRGAESSATVFAITAMRPG